ncbi:MAG: hypothetical protein LBT86_02740 [Deltaproteobacteria bacterium]|nr:hypothetical protein [Deltaproteobacteria bacterium]
MTPKRQLFRHGSGGRNGFHIGIKKDVPITGVSDGQDCKEDAPVPGDLDSLGSDNLDVILDFPNL